MSVLLIENSTSKAILVDDSISSESSELESNMFTALTVINLDILIKRMLLFLGPRDRQFSLKEISEVAGISYKNGHKWLKEGIIEPSIRGRQGQGRGRNIVFSFHDALVAGVAGALLRAGCSLKTIKVSCTLLRNTPIEETSKCPTKLKQRKCCDCKCKLNTENCWGKSGLCQFCRAEERKKTYQKTGK